MEGWMESGHHAAPTEQHRNPASASSVLGIYSAALNHLASRNATQSDIVDFSYERAVIDEMRRVANSILILDHHKSAEEDLRDLYVAPEWTTWREAANQSQPSSNVRCVVRFDMERSGAGLTWDYFNPGATRC
jgi:hypothetical protein